MTKLKQSGKAADIVFILWAGGCALLCYSMVYALRKPFTAATFDNIVLWGFSFKSVVTIVQILGYMISKFAGIKIVSELNHKYRLRFISGSAIAATVALLFFGLLPTPYNIIAMFFNGLALGCMWGVIFTFLEGRRMTDLLASILGISIIISSGTAKSIGLFVMNKLNISEFWMPALIGVVACPLIVALGWSLSKLPIPNKEDIALKVERITLDGSNRIAIFRKYSLLLTLLLCGNLLLTILRDIKEDFLVNIFDLSGHSDWVFAKVDTIVTFTILVLFGIMVLVRSNKRALLILMTGVIIASMTMAFISGNYSRLNLPPLVWLFVMSLSLYIPYLAFQTIFFDRFIAFFKIKGNVAFFISLIDSIGYSGTVLVLLLKEIIKPEADWLQVFNQMGVVVGVVCTVVFTASTFIISDSAYFLKRTQTARIKRIAV
jgi:MFS family permease